MHILTKGTLFIANSTTIGKNGNFLEKFAKLAQNKIAQPICCQNKHITVTVEKSFPKIRSSSVIFKKLSKLNYHQVGENSPNLVTLVASLVQPF
jgi:hypothetical protein